MKYFSVLVAVTAVFLFPLVGAGQRGEKEEIVNIYTHRHYEVDEQIFSRFEKETGIQVNVVNAGADELIQRLRMEGPLSPADILVSADAGRLVRARREGLLQPVPSPVLADRIPAHLKDPDNYWFGLTKRARVIVYHKNRVQPEELSSIEALADPGWKGRILLRSSSNIYNQSLLASLIAHHGEEAARQWAEGIVANMARPPQGNDRDQMKAIAAGIADVAVVNTYYVGHMLNSGDPVEAEVGRQIGILFPNQENRGSHINISGAGVTAHAPNRENAVRLLEYLVSDSVQEIFARANYEYPVADGVPHSDLVNSWGDFREDTLALSTLGELNSAAVRIFDEAGWK